MPTTNSRTSAHYSAALLTTAGPLGFSEPVDSEVEDALRMAERLMGCEVATVEALSEARSVQPAAMLVRRDEGGVSALVATLLLRPQAEEKLLSGTFDGRRPDKDDLSEAAEPPSFYYIWGVAAETKMGRWAIGELCRRLRFDALADLPAYMKAATPAGRRGAIVRLGFRPAAASSDDLLVSPPMTSGQGA